jgi:hypothetical protein
MTIQSPPPRATQPASAFHPPQPGKVISIPISVWADYLRLYNLEVVGAKGDVIITAPKTDRHESDKYPCLKRRNTHPPP